MLGKRLNWIKRFIDRFDGIDKKYLYFFMTISFVLHICGGIFSIGFYHYDEYYQIVEFASYKLGITHPNELAWEFSDKLRPTLQPWLMYWIQRIIALQDPFELLTLMRFISVISGFMVIWWFTSIVYHWIKNNIIRMLLIIMTSLSGLIPFLHCRFSSENISALFFIGGLCYLLQNQRHTIGTPKHSLNLFIGGLLIGLSIDIRLQAVLFLPGLALWLFFQKSKLKDYLLLILGGGLAICILIIADSIFYGTLVFTPYNYFYQNVISGVANKFGTMPWWGYIFDSYNIFGWEAIVFLITFLVCLYFRPKYVIVLSVFSFVFFHSMIAHKELRFLFPLLNFVPIIFALSFDTLFLKKPINLIINAKIISLMTIAIAMVTFPQIKKYVFNPVHQEFGIYDYIYHHNLDRSNHLIGKWEVPFNDYHDSTRGMNKYMPMKFILPSKTYNCQSFKYDNMLKHYLDSVDEPMYYITSISLRRLSELKDNTGADIEVIYQDIPSIIRDFNINNWQSRTSYPSLLLLKPKKKRHNLVTFEQNHSKYTSY